MDRVPAIAYGANAVPVTGAYGAPAGPRLAPAGAELRPSYDDVQNCTSLKKNGEQCQARPMKDSPYCIGHLRYEKAQAALKDPE